MSENENRSQTLMSAPRCCCIIPPYIHRAIAESQAASVATKEAAQRSLALATTIRAGRGAAVPNADAATFTSSSQPVATGLSRAIYSANDSEDVNALPGTPVRSEGQRASKDVSVDQCYDNFQYTYDFYSKIFGRNSVDDHGLTLVGSVHFGDHYSNASWMDPPYAQMVFGDGDGEFFVTGSFTKSLDVIGHELTHGVTANTANLEYEGQSGALNESVSDVFGSMVKQYHLNQTAAEADWLIGEGILYSKDDDTTYPLRSMKAPGTAYRNIDHGSDMQPASMADYVETQDDNEGVHINSGIPNRAFYLAAINLGGYSWEKAGQIWYKTLNDPRIKAPATVTFKSFAEITVELAGDDGQSVKDAWETVGVL